MLITIIHPSSQRGMRIYTSILQSKHLLQLRHLILQHNPKTKRLKRNSLANKMLTHRLHPMQPQRMQHRTRALHHHQHSNREHEPEAKEQEDGEDAQRTAHGEGVAESHAPEDDGELLMRERQGPETEVGGCVGDAVEAEFNGVDDLVDHDFAEFELLVRIASNVLSDDCTAVHIRVGERRAAVGLTVSAWCLGLIVIIV